MEFISKLFETQASLNGMLQICLDVIILGLLAVILTVRRPRMSKKDEAVVKSFENIMEQTAEISRKFEINLEQRKDLLQQITAKLDHRIQEAQALCVRLEHAARADAPGPVAQSSSDAGRRSRSADQQKVLSLAGKGLSAAEIAKSLKRPVGEVELILHLQKIAS